MNDNQWPSGRSGDPRNGTGRRHHRNEAGDDPEITRLLAVMKTVATRDAVDIDIDQLIAVAAAAAERRRSLRLTALRAAGVALIVGMLALWVVGFAPRGIDIAVSMLFFAVPAIAVFRWHLQAMDGRGILPWLTPSTVAAWSDEATQRVGDLDESILELTRLAARLDTIATEFADPGGTVTGGSRRVDSNLYALGDRVRSARSDIAELAARLGRCSGRSRQFISSCATAPGEADWTLLRDIERSRAAIGLRQIVRDLTFTAVNAPELFVDGDRGATDRSADMALALRDAQHAAERTAQDVGGRCGKVLTALDTLHRLAAQATLQRSDELSVIRRSTGPAAIAASGWLQPAAQRSHIRNLLLSRASTDSDAFWVTTVRQARADAFAQVGGA